MSSENLNSEIISGNILKLLKHDSFVRQEKTPITCQFILTNACNLKCIFCVNKEKKDVNWIKKQMPKEVALKAIRDLKDLGIKGIEFTGGGEPLIHPDFIEIVSYAIELGITPALVTNGVRLKRIPKELLSRFDWIRVSINSGRKNYKEIHKTDDYDNVMDSLEYIDDLDIPNKGVSSIFCSASTIDDVQSLIDDLQKFSLNYFRFSVDVLGQFDLSTDVFTSKNIPIISHTERPKRIPKTCEIFYYKPVIDCDGMIYPCCTNLYREVLPIANVENLKEIISDKNINIDTSKCSYCIYGYANDLIYNMGCAIKNVDFI